MRARQKYVYSLSEMMSSMWEVSMRCHWSLLKGGTRAGKPWEVTQSRTEHVGNQSLNSKVQDNRGKLGAVSPRHPCVLTGGFR